MKQTNLKLFVVLGLILGIFVILFEVGNLLFGKKVSDDAEIREQIISLPSGYDEELIARFREREKYLMINQEQFLGYSSASPIPTITAVPTDTPSETETPTPSISPTQTGSVTPTPTE